MFKIYDFSFGTYLITDTDKKRYTLGQVYELKRGEIEKWYRVTSATIGKYSKKENRDGFNGYCISKYILKEFSSVPLYEDELEKLEQTYICEVKTLDEVQTFFTEQLPKLQARFSEIEEEFKTLTGKRCFAPGPERKVWGEIYRTYRENSDCLSYEMEFKNTHITQRGKFIRA